ncbi:YgaP family membrane protein [Bradyrhizobium sp. HKCCYLS1011]|uniref:YgaP family membrane protein n=1 Tax=Bradyrhizobium sp. HKCCYLS1011 TaxID=3420733 RepID=UPI003EBFAD0A
MAQNIGKLDRTIRVIVGAAILSLVFVGPKTMWGLLGLIPLGTALIGWCPPYAMLGISTCGTKSS